VSDDLRRCSFDTVAATYERGRPPYADEAIEWIAERLGLAPGARVLDLAAGTGKLTRQLLPLGVDVVAVEPGDQMRSVLERVLPDVESLAGTAEAIPLPDASVDAVTVGQAFHWFRKSEALLEMHRVLRPGGGIALVWNVWDDEDPLLDAIDKRMHRDTPGPSDWRERYDRTLFGELDERKFRQRRTLTTDSLVEWVASTSAVATAEPEARELLLAEVRELAGAEAVDVSIATEVTAADRV
jgi:ubiquinone/menaquinone biosynthesis C-methylase UbiE